MRYIALLRGINVGGNKKVSMKELTTVLESIDHTDVKTYINSGNVIFSSSEKSLSKLTTELESAIENHFGFPVKVIVQTAEAVQNIAAAIPNNWVNDDSMKCDVIFLDPSDDSPAVVEVPETKEGIDTLKYVPGALIWQVDRNDINRSGLLKIVGTPLYRNSTIRNCNTVRKLAALMSLR